MDGYRNLASLGKAKEKSSRSATPSQPAAADKEKPKGKDEAKENGSKLKPNGTSSNGSANAVSDVPKGGAKSDAKDEPKSETPEIIVL